MYCGQRSNEVSLRILLRNHIEREEKERRRTKKLVTTQMQMNSVWWYAPTFEMYATLALAFWYRGVPLAAQMPMRASRPAEGWEELVSSAALSTRARTSPSARECTCEPNASCEDGEKDVRPVDTTLIQRREARISPMTRGRRREQGERTSKVGFLPRTAFS